MAGLSTDGDPKCLSAMIYESSLPNEIGITTTQDPIHIGGKSRNRLLKPNIKLPIGKCVVTIEHLRNLVKNVHKSVHGLTHSDIFPVDRMNYGSFEKMVQDRVLKALQIHVPGSEATIHYLRIFRDILNSFLEFDLKPLERVLQIWRSLFFLRIWREYIEKSPFYDLANNFITYNTYMGVEINANSLIQLIKLFRDRNTPEQFLPALFDSQTCERTFRLFRSTGTTQFTKINFTILDLIHMIGRNEVLNDISYCKLNIEGIEMPHKRKSKTIFYELPTNEELYDTIEKAKLEAIQIAQTFEISNHEQIGNFQFKSRLKLDQNEEEPHEIYEEEYYNESMNSDLCMGDEIMDDIVEYHGADNADELDLDLIEDDNSYIDPNSPLLYVMDETGQKKLIPKSTFLWMLTGSKRKMTNNRLKRFQFNNTIGNNIS